MSAQAIRADDFAGALRVYRGMLGLQSSGVSDALASAIKPYGGRMEQIADGPVTPTVGLDRTRMLTVCIFVQLLAAVPVTV